MRALVIVDVQYDFLPGGALAVPEGDQVIEVINRISPRFELVVATQDWHPADHVSFAESHPGREVGDSVSLEEYEQMLWPTHCVQETPGAALAEQLDVSRVAQVFFKGVRRDVDSYSGFFDNVQANETGLFPYLERRGVRELYIAGLALDYCVQFTALDAYRLGFATFVVEDACRAVDLPPGNREQAVATMREAGVTLISSGDISEVTS